MNKRFIFESSQNTTKDNVSYICRSLTYFIDGEYVVCRVDLLNLNIYVLNIYM